MPPTQFDRSRKQGFNLLSRALLNSKYRSQYTASTHRGNIIIMHFYFDPKHL